MTFAVDNDIAFEIPLNAVTAAVAQKNEASLEFFIVRWLSPLRIQPLASGRREACA
jgi:hypothetical protein